ncbi:MAG: glycosyltransferase family 2 protein [Bacteroidota bacterium]|nr:family 2 glycosyl transferase [Odoribacter sp.]MDP3642742.1 glycosyltransferase family 2 protein [Bacteroidota bacterium]
MGSFADRYIQNNVIYPAFIPDEVSPSPGMIVMIPCLNEPEIIPTLQSLWACDPVLSFCEVIVAVNDSESSSPEIKQFNADTFQKLVVWKLKNDRPNLVLHPIYAKSVNAKHAGAGMARKIGMDEAVRRFNSVSNPNGIIISTDSDCLFSSNYMQRIESNFKNKSCFAATVNFKHRIEEMDDQKQKTGIQLYEDYLHYYKKALDFTGFPNSIYTIGSAFAVRAEAYVKQGGMNRRQAGEDFYFLHKLTKLGTITEINDAFVYPSARISDRVPFGTGASMTKWMNDAEDLALTYNFSAFLALKVLFDRADSLFRIDAENYSVFMSSLPGSVQEYLQTIDFSGKLDEINKNSSSVSSFRKRFFQFFDAFIILRFLNLAHQNHFQRQNLSEAIRQLQEQSKK